MKSLELNWIRNEDKSLVIPEVVFSSLTWAGGMYHPPEENEVCIDGKFYDLAFGLIEVSIKSIDNVASILAHEWRHHWQRFHGWKFDTRFHWPKKVKYEDYDGLIVRYFTENKHEMDAVRFQNRHVGVFDGWDELLHEYLQ